jgi:putative flippase GtrA
MQNKITVQIKKFLTVGFIAVSLDWVIYVVLTQTLGLNSLFSKATSYMAGTVFAFVCNGLFVFQSNLIPSKFIKHIALYSISLLSNTLTFYSLEKSLDPGTLLIQWAPITLATMVSTAINFAGLRYWVFKSGKVQNVEC